MIFTVEEIALIGSFDHSSKEAVLADMAEQLGLVNDIDLKESIRKTAEKIKGVSDEEFGNIDYTVYGEEHE